MEILETIVFIGTLFIVVYLYILQPNQVKGQSMEPSYYSSDYIFTSKITYKLWPPKRCDVIVFISPKNDDQEYIKRIIGLPGDQILIQNSQVFVNDKLLEETYISAATETFDYGFAHEGQIITVPQDNFFVMGDNRPRSSDSREFGPIPISSVIGMVFYRYLPANKMGFIKNPWPEKLSSLNIFIPKQRQLSIQR